MVLLMFEQVKAVVQDKREEHVVDSSLENCPEDEINNVFNIALMCLELEPSRRPTMAEVVKMLEKIKSDTVANLLLMTISTSKAINLTHLLHRYRCYRKLVCYHYFHIC